MVNLSSKKYNFILYKSLNLISMALKHNLKHVRIVNTKKTRQLVFFFIKRGVINDFVISKSNLIEILLNYNYSTKAIFNKFYFISKPSRRVFLSYLQLKNYNKQNFFFGLVLTSYGFLSILDCLKYKIGGELIFITK